MLKYSPKNRQAGLDILRGVAILLVLGRHLPEGNSLMSGWAITFFHKWNQIGWSGVDLFFVLSSFLISGLLFKEFIKTGNLDIKRFLIRRGLRIYPAFYLMIFVSALFLWQKTHIRQYLVEIFYLQSYVRQGSLWFHTWSLAIEEHFYIVISILFLFLLKKPSTNPFRVIPWLWLVAALTCLLLRVWTPYDSTAIFTNTHLRLDAFLFGMTLSYFFHFYRDSLDRVVRSLWPLLILFSIFCLWPITRLDLGREPYLTRFGLTLTYLAYGTILLLTVTRKPVLTKPSLIADLLAALGRRSYSVYLWHAPILYLVAQPLVRSISKPEGLWLGILVYLFGAVAVGELTYRYIETPILLWRDRRFTSNSSALNL